MAKFFASANTSLSSLQTKRPSSSNEGRERSSFGSGSPISALRSFELADVGWQSGGAANRAGPISEIVAIDHLLDRLPPYPEEGRGPSQVALRPRQGFQEHGLFDAVLRDIDAHDADQLTGECIERAQLQR